MGLPSSRLGQPVFPATPTQGATMEYGGNRAAPGSQNQVIPGLPIIPEALPQFTPEEARVLREQFMNRWNNRPRGALFGGRF